jgi:photosystem II stability/assembly factor-like uncharacterized protein
MRHIFPRLCFVTVVFAGHLAAQGVTPDSYKQLQFRYIGPVGNRISAVAGVAGDPWVYYAGSASGGIFKTTDGGATWAPIFDGQPVSSIAYGPKTGSV